MKTFKYQKGWRDNNPDLEKYKPKPHIRLWLFVALVCLLGVACFGWWVSVKSLDLFVENLRPLAGNDKEIKEMAIPEKIKIASDEYEIDPKLPLAIAFCESSYRNIANTNGEKYGIGVFQFVKSTWNEQCKGDIYNENENIICGVKLIAKGELWRWQSSRHCWDKKIIK